MVKYVPPAMHHDEAYALVGFTVGYDQCLCPEFCVLRFDEIPFFVSKHPAHILEKR
jgi:hypothetical protein